LGSAFFGATGKLVRVTAELIRLVFQMAPYEVEYLVMLQAVVVSQC